MIDYIDQFRNEKHIRSLITLIEKYAPQEEKVLMEVCGGHTLTIVTHAIQQVIPPQIKLVSGPGCPVCVASETYIDRALALSKKKDVIIASFGDLLRVPGSEASLIDMRALYNNVKVCLSPMDALNLAKNNPSKEIVFLAIGFETTVPGIAATIKCAYAQKISNFSILSAMKTMPRALELLCGDPEIRLDGLICPGHVSAITGTGIYRPLAEEFDVPCVVAGFEPADILFAISSACRLWNENRADVINGYPRVVREEGNVTAQTIINEIFLPASVEWRGFGIIEESGLALRDAYAQFDAEKRFDLSQVKGTHNSACRCGDIMKGKMLPPDCPLFADICTPQSPKGACMVSTEGSCSVYYKYKRE